MTGTEEKTFTDHSRTKKTVIKEVQGGENGMRMKGTRSRER